MLKKFLLSSLLVLPLFMHAQEENRYGLIPVTDENRAYVEQERAKIPLFRNMVTRSARENVTLPTSLDNSKNKYFPPVIEQLGNSCGPASMIHYIYTYELNRVLDRDGKDPANISEYLYIYNFLNDGEDKGTLPEQIFNAIRWYGSMSEEDFNISSTLTKFAITEWADGYDKYYTAAKYGLAETVKFISDEDGEIENMKRYLYDRGDGSQGGGFIQFSGWAHPLDASNYDGPSELGCKAIIPRFGFDGMHSMTIVGYDDTVWWDYNSNGTKESDELGAFLCVNTWGSEYWGDEGFFYAPYRTFTIMPQSSQGVDNGGGTGNGGKQCYGLTPLVKEAPKMMLKMKIQHTIRGNLKYVLTGYDKTGTEILKHNFNQMKNEGGNYPMRAGANAVKDVLEFGFDLTDIYNKDIVEYKLTVVDKAGYQQKLGSGLILACSIVDMTSGTAMEIPAFISQPVLENGVDGEAIISMSSEMPQGVDVNISHVTNKRSLFLNFRSAVECEASVVLLDINRKVVETYIQETIPAGVTAKQVEIGDNISAGIYYLRTIVNNNVEIKKIELE